MCVCHIFFCSVTWRNIWKKVLSLKLVVLSFLSHLFFSLLDHFRILKINAENFYIRRPNNKNSVLSWNTYWNYPRFELTDVFQVYGSHVKRIFFDDILLQNYIFLFNCHSTDVWPFLCFLFLTNGRVLLWSFHNLR